MPQAYFVPVSPTFSRITQSSGVLGSTSTSWVLPLMVKRTIALPLPGSCSRSNSSPGITAAATASSKAPLCRVATAAPALRDENEEGQEDEADGINPVILRTHADDDACG